jgi:hypothetical protein
MTVKEDAMAKGQVKGNKEAKKPKGDKPKGPGSAYKQSQGKGGPATNPFARERSAHLFPSAARTTGNR